MERDLEKKIAHLSFIQGVVNRMGQNSFLLKGWCVTLIAAIFALSSKDSNSSFILLAYFPAFMFWVLDAFFLHQEKLYRTLYKMVANEDVTSEKFTLDTSIARAETPNIVSVFISKTVFPFYGLLIGVIILAVMLIETHAV